MEKQLPKNWINVNLQDVTKNVKGKKPKIQSGIEFEGSVPYMDIKALEYNEIRQFADIESSKHFEEGDVAMVWDGARSGWVSKTNFGAIGSTLVAFKPVKINSNYLFYYLLEKYPFINSNARGVGIPHVDPTILWSLDFPLPPLPEQNRVVTKLDALFVQLETIKSSMATVPLLLKDFRQQVLNQAVTGKLTEEWRKNKKNDDSALLDEIFQYKKELINSRLMKNDKEFSRENFVIPKSKYPYFVQNWVWLQLKDCTSLVTDGKHGDCKDEENSGFYFLSVKNMKNGVLDYSNSREINEKEFIEVHNRTNLEIGDVLISSTGATIGKVAIANDIEKTPFTTFQKSVAIIKNLKKYLDSNYLKYYLLANTEKIKDMTSGTAQPNLLLTDLKKLLVPIPKLEEQQEIVTQVESLFAKADAIEKQYESLKAKIENLPQAFLHKAFKGELTEQLESDGDARDLLKEIETLKAVSGKLKKDGKVVKGYKVKDDVLGMVAESKV